MLKDWRSLKVGDKIRWYGKEFDGSWDLPCKVIEIKSDCVIADWDGVKLPIDDWSMDQFKRV